MGLFGLTFEPFCGAYCRTCEQGEGLTWVCLGLTIHEALKGVWFTQDAEEFPILAVASERRDRDRVESRKCQSKQQPQVNSRLKATIALGLPSLAKLTLETKLLSRLLCGGQFYFYFLFVGGIQYVEAELLFS